MEEEKTTVQDGVQDGVQDTHEVDLVEEIPIQHDVDEEPIEPIVVDEELQSELLAFLDEPELPAVVEDNLPVVEEEPKEVLETINDLSFPPFDVYVTTHGWWSDVVKVKNLIEAFKKGANIIQACVYTGISREQYYYFAELHPDFYYIKELCEEYVPMRSLENIYKEITEKGNIPLSQWMLAQRDKRFGKTSNPDDDKHKGNIINHTTNVVVGANDKQVKKIVSTIADSVEKQIERESLSGSDTGPSDDMEEQAEEES